MTSLARIRVPLVCIVAVSGASIAWWFHKRNAVEWKKVSDAATLSRVRKAAKEGDAKAQFDLAVMCYKGRGLPQDYAEAARWYRKAADQGYAKAQMNLGDMYHDGKDVPLDYAEGFRWCQKAAEQGDARAQDAVGYMHWNGQGVPQDYTEALRWYKKAAEQGEPIAQQSLGYMYSQGQGVSRDYTEANRWYRKAAEQGDARAQYSLGYMYATGQGVLRDYIEAHRWYLEAAKRGNPEARRALESLRTRSSEARRSEWILIAVGFPAGLVFSLDFLLPGRRLRDWRQVTKTLLGLLCLSNAGLNLYAVAHDDMLYSPYFRAFHRANLLLGTTAILIMLTVMLPGWRKQSKGENSSPT